MEKKTRAEFGRLIEADLVNRGYDNVDVEIRATTPKPQAPAIRSKWKSPPAEIPPEELDEIIQQLQSKYEIED